MSTFRYFTIFIFLCATVSVTEAQHLADSLFRAGCYSKAAMEYERMVFEAQSRDEVLNALLGKAQCQKAMGHYADAASTLKRTAVTEATLAQLLVCLYLSEQYHEAAQLFEDYMIESDSIDNSLLLIYIFTLNELYRYNDSHAAALELAGRCRVIDALLVDSIYSLAPKQKKEQTAQWLSIVPGLGHLYAGYPLEALTALLLNGAALGFGVWQVFKSCYFTAWLGGAGLLASTYPGNMTSAKLHVRKRNFHRNDSFNRMCKEKLTAAFTTP